MCTVTPFVHFLCKIVIFMAFTLVCAKMYVILNVLHLGTLSNVFSSQMFLTSYVKFLTAIPYSLLSTMHFCMYYVFCWYLKCMPICCKYCKSQHLLALAKANANAFNAIKVLKMLENIYLLFFLSKITLM